MTTTEKSRDPRPSGGQSDGKAARARYCVYLTVLPAYRTTCVNIIKRHFGDAVSLFASPAHLDASVRSGIPRHQYTQVGIIRFGRVAYLQWGHWKDAIRAESTLLDLNPRNISAWAILLARKVLRRRTVVWGHIHGRRGPASRTAPIRRAMRALADGFVAYTYTSRSLAVGELPGQPVWVAPNALYDRDTLTCKAAPPGEETRDSIVYVGRFAEEKKVLMAIRGFAAFAQIEPRARLVLVGAGSQDADAKELTATEGLESRVDFPGWINDPEALRRIYSKAVCSVSPGFIGLNLTQSMGFGVPMVASRDEPHAPEVELAEAGGVQWFVTDDAGSMAEQLAIAFSNRGTLPNCGLASWVRDRYSAEAMASGIIGSLTNSAPSHG